jgi:hypothetical protein
MMLVGLCVGGRAHFDVWCHRVRLREALSVCGFGSYMARAFGAGCGSLSDCVFPLFFNVLSLLLVLHFS